MDSNTLKVALADMLKVLFSLLAKISKKEYHNRFFKKFNATVSP
jgi:hypothetical protein